MATYKVIQDIEAEDHIIGPLSLRQFIYALVAIFCLYLSFIVISKHAAFLLVVFLPPGLFFGFLAFPFGKDQSTEVWALAKLRFYFKPRRRIWNQSGVKELVTITVPKKLERVYTDGLSQVEVKSRLKALANTIDSRGWAIKNVNVNMYRPPTMESPGSSERLIDLASIPQAVPDYEVAASDDMLDENSNPVAQQFSQMIGASAQAHRKELIDHLNEVRDDSGVQQSGAPADYWFLNQPVEPPSVPAGNAVFSAPQVVAPGSSDTNAVAVSDDAALTARLKQNSGSQTISNSRLRTIQPLGTPKAAAALGAAGNKGQTASSKSADPAILELANNNDFNVSTLAREAKKSKGEDLGDDEVVISLH